jgi:hypothetical protein
MIMASGRTRYLSSYSDKTFLLSVLLSVFFLCLHGCMTEPATQRSKIQIQNTEDYALSTTCQNCHGNIYDQYAKSMHALAYGDLAFQAQYFDELLPQAAGDEKLQAEADRCLVCHAPVVSLKKGGRIVTREQVADIQKGVNCDFCHTIRGFKGEKPGGGNFDSTPGDEKFGPFRHTSKWHHVYSEFQTKSEFCGICHNDVNHHGLEIKSTYSEWKESNFARKKIECQECHMSAVGFLVHGESAYVSGKAADMNVGEAAWRNRLYSHWFPGAHSKSQIGNAMIFSLNLKLDRPEASHGEQVHITIDIGNEKVGHSMPSGSADLRMMWVELTARIDDRVVRIPVVSEARETSFDVAGSNEFDQETFQRDVPAGSRIYRSVFIDQSGRPTLASYQAVKIVFDNRLKAEEVRKEHYKFTIPDDARGSLYFTAMVKYVRYPSGFAARLNIDKIDPVIISAVTKELKIK